MRKQSMQRLPLRLRVLGWLMRHMPKGHRVLRYCWLLLFRLIGAEGYFCDPAVDENWPKGPQPPVRGKHGVMMLLDLSNWGERRTYFSGTYFQEHLVLLLENLIRSGDIFIDVGANVGMITILAARLIGPSGSVYSFEPDPNALPGLREHIKLNKLANVSVFEAGLSDQEGQATLVEALSALRWVSLGGLPEKEHGDAIRLVRGDDVLRDLDLSRPVILKIDVEGHEVHALRGLSGFLERRELAVICEVNRDQLSRSASTPEVLFNFMKDHAFNVFGVYQRRWSRRLQLTRLEAPLSHPNYDVLFLRSGTALWHRVNPT